MSRVMPWTDIKAPGERLHFYVDNPEKVKSTSLAATPEARRDPCVSVLLRVLGALSDEMATRLDPRRRERWQELDDAWNVDIMTDAMRVLKEHGITWYPTQEAVRKKIAEVVLTEI